MNLRTVASVLVLIAMAWQSVGVESVRLEPVHLGSGLSDQVINLSSATKITSINYNYSSTAIIPPKKPHIMALSTSSMINQAKYILTEAQAAREEAVAAREEARILRNETLVIYSEARKLLAEINKSKSILVEINESRELLAEINERELRIQSMQEKVESEAKASAASAAQASAFLNKTDETYEEILRLSAEINDNVERIRSTIQGARNLANSSVMNTIQSLGDMLPVAKKS